MTDTLTRFLKKFQKNEGLTQGELAKRVGLTQATASRILRHGWDKAADVETVLQKIGGGYNFDPTHLPNYTFIRKVLARPCAGGGSLENSGEEEARLAFRTAWLRSRTTSSPDMLAIMQITGESMLPTFYSGDLALVDEGVAGRELWDGKCYIIRVEREIFVKRLRKGPKRLLFMSDNQTHAFQTFEVPDEPSDEFAVIGKILWSCREHE